MIGISESDIKISPYGAIDFTAAMDNFKQDLLNFEKSNMCWTCYNTRIVKHREKIV